ncbi:MAG: patatin family protein, partial [Clostridia bacterium]|nr:patatin family protein [Clostridia bacterium]
MKTALSMEGGAMRGMFTCGVIDVLMENGITFDAAAGISAGAAFGCNFKSRQIGRPIRYNKRYGSDPRYMSFRSLLKTGDLYNADFCYRELPDVLDPFDRKAFRDNPMAFYIGATDVKTGKCVYHLCSDGEETDILWMRASASMPLVSRPVEVDGLLLLDGGITDPVPLDHMQSLGFDRHVVILTQPKG